MATTHERRGDTDVTLGAPAPATVTFRVGGDEVELDGTVIQASARTVVVELASGAGALALAMAAGCELVLHAGDVAVQVAARPGRRVDDVPESRKVELVLLDRTVDPRRLLGLAR